MDEITYREMMPADLDAALAVRNEVFPDTPIVAADWQRDGMLASIALLGDDVIGAIPLAVRDLVIAPGVVIAAPFENSVGTREAYRSRGVGAGMITAALDFMHDRADGLFVYRGGERTAGYRFYQRSGHHVLLAVRAHRLESPITHPAAVVRVTEGAEAVAAAGERMLPLFASTYGGLGGFPKRTARSCSRALASCIFAEIPTDFSLVSTHDHDELVGYAIVGVRTTHVDGVAHVLEMATRAADLDLATSLLAGVGRFAAERRLTVEMMTSDDDPLLPALQASGFVAQPRDMFLMGQLIDVPRFFNRYWSDRVRLDGVGLRVSTPARDDVLREPDAGFPTLSLEMTEETLHRWLLGRVDLAARLREGTVTAYGAAGPACAAVGRAIPWTPWAFHYLDWI